MERMSEQNSTHTVDPRYLSKAKLDESLRKTSAMNSEVQRYSILSKKKSVEEIFSRDAYRMRKIRSQKGQPRQQYLIKNKKYGEMALYMYHKSYLKHDRFCKIEDEEEDCLSLLCCTPKK